ncbi:MAG: PhzF family phenazine biosynthesis isomerase [Akkermansiaceae bacterium]
MVQPVPEFGTILEDRATLARGLGLAASDLSDSLPAQIVSAGVEFLLVPLASRTAVDSITFNRSSLQGLFEAAGSPERGVVTFAPEPARGDGPGAYTRMVAPCLGVSEDPATGGASGPLGAYPFRYHLVTATQATRMVSIQGAKMGRPSRITISLATAEDSIQRVGVGGGAVLAGEGSLACSQAQVGLFCGEGRATILFQKSFDFFTRRLP